MIQIQLWHLLLQQGSQYILDWHFSRILYNHTYPKYGIIPLSSKLQSTKYLNSQMRYYRSLNLEGLQSNGFSNIYLNLVFVSEFEALIIWWSITLQPIEIQGWLVPYSKGQICGQGHSSSFRVCEIFLKSDSLLHTDRALLQEELLLLYIDWWRLIYYIMYEIWQINLVCFISKDLYAMAPWLSHAKQGM